MKRILTILILFLSVTAGTTAMPKDSTRIYTETNPLIYEDVWDLWPYSFLNEAGQPEGYNIDLIRLLMDELGIPYSIKLKPSQEAFRDLRDGKSDLMLGLAVGFHDEFGKYSTNAVTLFTQSLVRPKSMPLTIRRFHDLSSNEVIVNDSSLAHHLMVEYGWGMNAHPVEDMREAIQQVSQEEKGMILWNTLSLKWLIKRYQLDNLELTEVNMQHGQYKFMSNDTQLLSRLDKAYSDLYAAGKITPLQDKWFYPERNEETYIAPWVWYTGAAILLLTLIIGIYALTYRLQARKLTELNQKRNKRLGLILKTSQVHMWTYDIASQEFSWRNDNGKVAYQYSREEFARRYTAEDFSKLMAAIDELAALKATDDRNITIELKAKDMEGGDTETRDYRIALSVLNRDGEGNPTVIMGTKKDITEERRQQRHIDERTMRYWTIFYNIIVGIILFDKDGRLQNINPLAAEMLHADIDEIISQAPGIAEVLGPEIPQPDEADGFIGKREKDGTSIQYHLMSVKGENGHCNGLFAICLDRTQQIAILQQATAEEQQKKQIEATLEEYNSSFDNVLQESDVRLASYSPLSHTLTIHRGANEIQHQLTQTRCMTLIDDHSKKLAMRLLYAMDSKQQHTVEATIHTTLRDRARLPLVLEFSLMPITDRHGNVTEYRGICMDRSNLSDIYQQARIQADKVQEVEDTKNSFVRNMVQEIRKPMGTISRCAEQLDENNLDDDPLRNEILDNADYLLHLIDNILFLSRLEAHMVEINPKETNFAETFESQCNTGWHKHQNADTRYIVENPYEQLVVDIDTDAIGQAIRQVTENAAQHTRQGTVRARYDYIGRRLIISVDDTGEGIPAEAMQHINDEHIADNTQGLGLAICRELMHQMGGTLEVSSEEGSGTTVYMTLPCHAKNIKRRR